MHLLANCFQVVALAKVTKFFLRNIRYNCWFVVCNSSSNVWD